MSLAVVFSRGRQGIEAPLVTVEVHLANGLPGFSIVGLPEIAVKESRDRVRGAIQNCRFKFPQRRIIVNLAPADLPKEGGRFDLPIALGILAASDQVRKDQLHRFEFLGELSLGGELRAVAAVLPVSLAARNANRGLIIPTANCLEAMYVGNAEVLGTDHLLKVCAHLNGHESIVTSDNQTILRHHKEQEDFSDVIGQYQAKRALEIAATGGHNLLMLGPPGTGKSMLASRMPSILPALSEDQAIETASIGSISDVGFNVEAWGIPPFRSPHHTASAAALVGGGNNPKPGEISLAHNGVLFLDELPEFDRKVLEVLREPLETGKVTISRAKHRAEFYASFQLIAAMNPCPCGYLGDSSGRCSCTSEQISRYRARISGPLLDRIDMHIEVPRASNDFFRAQRNSHEECSADIKKRVTEGRFCALERCGKQNAGLTPSEIKKYCTLPNEGEKLLEQAVNNLGLSHRAYHRILKLARTIADLADSNSISVGHLSEAISYRRLDRKTS